MSTFSVMVISITVQNSALDSAGILEMNSNRIASFSRQHPLQCRGCRSCHGVQAACGPDPRSLEPPPCSAERASHHAVMANTGPTHARVFLLQISKVWFDTSYYSLFASMKLPYESEFFSASFPTQAGSQRGALREHTVHFLGHATTCHISKDKAGENKTITVRSSKDWLLHELL